MWFKKHLNWTLVFAMLATYILNFVLLIIIANAKSYELLGYFFIVSPIWLLVHVGVTAWVLWQKGRSLFHLFLLLLGWIGIAVILCLQHQEELKSREEKRAEKIAQDNLRAMSWQQRER